MRVSNTCYLYSTHFSVSNQAHYNLANISYHCPFVLIFCIALNCILFEANAHIEETKRVNRILDTKLNRFFVILQCCDHEFLSILIFRCVYLLFIGVLDFGDFF